VLNRERLLLGAWCAVVLGAGVLSYTLNEKSGTVSGALALTWIAGYLVQFGLMMVILNVIGRRNAILPWFVASLLPWAVDWTVPDRVWLLAVWVPVVIGYAYWLEHTHDHTERVLRTGVRGTATVLGIVHHQFQTVVNNAYIRRKLQVSVRTEKGETFQTTMTGTFAFGSEPDAGDTFAVRIDPAHPKRIVVDNQTADDNRLTSTGVHAQGVVRAVHPHHPVNGLVPCRLDLSVTHGGTGLQYDTHLDATFSPDRVPSVGDSLAVLADPDDYTRVILPPGAESTVF
jgi:hypothetical protein